MRVWHISIESVFKMILSVNKAEILLRRWQVIFVIHSSRATCSKFGVMTPRYQFWTILLSTFEIAKRNAYE